MDPISTAPRDGRTIILLWEGRPRRRVEARYVSIHTTKWKRGWQTKSDPAYGLRKKWQDATHWCPVGEDTPS